MNFDRFFKLLSYAVVFCGFFSLFVSGGVGTLSTGLFVLVLIVAWLLEGSRWQISERLGTVSVFIVVPLFYIGRKYQVFGFGANIADLAAMLAQMILVLSAIKLLQRKAERDWLFLYLMAFFEVLLAAGLSISPLYLISLILYLLVTICAIVAFEIRKTSASLSRNSDYKKIESTKETSFINIPLARLPMTATALLVLIVVFAAPLFFALPRVGGAGLGSNQKGLSNVTGFSDSVNLGEIGSLLQNDEIVMRARIDKTDGKNLGALHWRGVALDSFDNKRWSKSENVRSNSLESREGNFYKLYNTTNPNNLTVQTVYLEPIDTPVLFALQQPILVQGNFQSFSRDTEGALKFTRGNFERLSYKAYSDRSLPDASLLRSDNENYAPEFRRYLQLPGIDSRIVALAAQVSGKQANRYDKAKAVETYLQTEFGYTLEMKAKGNEPLADFLFNVREGHCEYFATAMAIMLRTQGIATRVVNGFQQGEYNDTAGVFVVRQKDAHSWVEVYFPRENAWIPFDPTPAAGRFDDSFASSSIFGKFNNYLVALETFWIQYFVSYDNQEQKTLMRSVKNSFVEYQAKTSGWLNEMQTRLSEWWAEVRGDKGLQASAKAIAFGILYLLATILGIVLIIWLYRKIKQLSVWQRILGWLKFRRETTIIEFYERMQRVLASKGFNRAAHQTPLEFAFALNLPEAVSITEKYNRVRFGEKNLSKDEILEVEDWLKNLEAAEK